MALNASSADVALTLVRLAVHYERLAAETHPQAQAEQRSDVRLSR
jgi:hypothetical protein